MSRIKSSGSEIERALGSEMFRIGLRYRKQYPVIGRPDFAFPNEKVAVFCDSRFWHGRDWLNKRKEIKVNRDFWISKIECNMKRDETVNESLSRLGWMVIRFWEDEISKDAFKCALTVKHSVRNRRKLDRK